MVDTEGPVEVASQRSGGQRGEDRKIDQIVLELRRYNVSVGALQETKWFGDEVYEVNGSVLLTAGRPSPAEGMPVVRGEGVALVLDGLGLAAWKRGGKQWKAWSSRCLSACLDFGGRIGKFHVMSCYAPTRAASRQDKDNFFQQLDTFLTSLLAGDRFVLLGDFNARVGSREVDDQWADVLGPHGYGVVNDAGRELLSFLLCHEVTVCNTWFEKKNIYKQTWQHPKSKQWNCIDYVMVSQRDRKYCLDVSVKRGAYCNTDHHLVCVKLKFGWNHRRNVVDKADQKERRFDVGKLYASGNEAGDHLVADQYLECVLERASASWPEDGTVEEKWKAVSAALTSAADGVLGTSSRRQPDWFSDSQSRLKPLLNNRNRAYTRWLQTGKAEDLVQFRKVRRDARRAVREARNLWFKEKAAAVEHNRFGGKEVWNCIRDMQRGKRGRVPSRMVTINDEAGLPCQSVDAQHQRWRRHFIKVLNVVSQYDVCEMNLVKEREVFTSLGDLPSNEDVDVALQQLKNGKAAGKSRILPEMLKVGRTCPDFVAMLTDLVRAVWREREVPQAWRDAILVPVPKKGNLRCCDNWRGIALLDVVGKMLGRIVQNRLQKLGEKVLPESQCGFRKGRSCTDMIFMVRQLTEKAIEHDTMQYFVFVDLRKAYDSVPRAALWLALLKLGVPETLVEIVKSFHDNMEAGVRVDGELLEEFEVTNGLRQGCTMAPTLFNLYSCIVAERWAEKVKEIDDVGTLMLCKQDNHLFRRSTRNADEVLLKKGEFADDVVLLARSRDAACAAIRSYVEVASSLGLTVSFVKTKFVVVGTGVTDEEKRPLVVGDDFIEGVEQFPYLGSLISDDGRVSVEVERRIANASKAFGALREAVFKNSNLSIETKRFVYRACVLSVLLYGGECWAPLRGQLRKLNSFHHRCVRSVLGITNQQQWEQRISSGSVRAMWGDLESISTKLRKKRLEWLGHVARMPSHRIPRICLFGWLPQTRPFHGPKKRWRDVLKDDLTALGIKDGCWHQKAQDRLRWMELWSQCTCDQQGQQTGQVDGILCTVCRRTFRRESDRARHKCIAERQLPIQEQAGAVQCTLCQRWFRSRGGLAVHKCVGDHHVEERESVAPQEVLCTVCQRSFRRPGDLKRHKCLPERQKPVYLQQGAVQCKQCGRWFRSAGGLSVHRRSCNPR